MMEIPEILIFVAAVLLAIYGGAEYHPRAKSWALWLYVLCSFTAVFMWAMAAQSMAWLLGGWLISVVVFAVWDNVLYWMSARGKADSDARNREVLEPESLTDGDS